MEKNLIECPIDNKNLMEDPFEDSEELFGNFFVGRNHRVGSERHFVGVVEVYDEEFPKCVNSSGIVDASWNYGSNTVTIHLLAVSPCEDFDTQRDEIFEHYKKIFKSWECEENPGLVVRFGSENDKLYVHFYYDTEKC